LPIYPVEEDEKWEILRKIMKKLESNEVKKALVRDGVTPVDKIIVISKVVIFSDIF